MVKHLVLAKAKPDCYEALTSLLRDFCKMAPTGIPGVISATSGTNFSPISQEFTHGLEVGLKDREALDVYLKHPEHTKVGEELKSLIDSRELVDYET